MSMSGTQSAATGAKLRHRQDGVALVVALILLVVITLLGLAAIRGATLQQRMSGNFSDREIAFQGAEAALQAGAGTLDATPTGVIDCTVTAQACPINPFTSATPPPTGSVHTVVSGETGFTISPNGASQPQYVIEKLGQTLTGGTSSDDNRRNPTCLSYTPCGTPPDVNQTNTYYRITARSGDPAAIGNRAVVTLQAIYRR